MDGVPSFREDIEDEAAQQQAAAAFWDQHNQRQAALNQLNVAIDQVERSGEPNPAGLDKVAESLVAVANLIRGTYWEDALRSLPPSVDASKLGKSKLAARVIAIAALSTDPAAIQLQLEELATYPGVLPEVLHCLKDHGRGELWDQVRHHINRQRAEAAEAERLKLEPTAAIEPAPRPPSERSRERADATNGDVYGPLRKLLAQGALPKVLRLVLERLIGSEHGWASFADFTLVKELEWPTGCENQARSAARRLKDELCGYGWMVHQMNNGLKLAEVLAEDPKSAKKTRKKPRYKKGPKKVQTRPRHAP